MMSSSLNLLVMMMMITIFFYTLLIPFTSSLSFNFTTFNSGDSNITYERSASPYNQVIQLTGDTLLQNVVGRATYSKPMHLWDKASGKLTDFSTHFSFFIDSQGQNLAGSGLAFFLAPNGSHFNLDEAQGGALALTTYDKVLDSTDNPFVAVEIDTSSDLVFDPPTEHVGININSMKSVTYVPRSSDCQAGKTCEAWITYNSTSQNLSVVFTGNNTIQKQFLYRNVNLSSYLPEWVTFGFSAATGDYTALHTIHSWDFSSTLEIEGTPISPNSSAPNNKLGLAVGLGAGGFVLVCGLTLFLFVLWKRSRGDKEYDHAMDEEFEKGTGPKKFSYNELACATSNFKEKLGQGGFGGVYRGFLKDMNSYVAVKKVSKGSKQGKKEYASEVNIISRLRHRNLVQLIGWCHERRELLLVYEFMPNRSLDSHLFNENSLLKWVVRYKIAKGLASALQYLHEEWEQCVVHRDIKSSNVMLDSNFNAKLGDFGLARFVDHAKGSQTTVLAGTKGYMAPEYATTGRASKESDVYSFGVVALEIACGRKPINYMAHEDQVIMVEWVWELYGSGNVLEAVDPRLDGDFDEEQMERLMIVGLWCAHPDHNIRPSIRKAIHVLNFEAPLPVLPSNLAPPVRISSFSLSHGSEEGQTNFQAIVTAPIPHTSLHPLQLLPPHRFCTHPS